MRAPCVTASRQRWPDRIARVTRLSGCPAAVRGVRGDLLVRGSPLRPLRERSVDGSEGDRARPGRGRPRDRGLALRRPGPEDRSWPQVRPPPVPGGGGRRRDAACAPFPRDRRGRSAGAGRSLAVALARLRPRRGNRMRTCGSFRDPHAGLPAPRPGSPAGGEEEGRSARRPAAGLGGDGSTAEGAGGGRRLDHRCHALGLRSGASRSWGTQGGRADAGEDPLDSRSLVPTRPRA
jgi:hypothetical protein